MPNLRKQAKRVLWVLSVLLLSNAASGSAGAEEEELVWKIAFTSSRDGDDEIYVMDADGTNQKDSRTIREKMTPRPGARTEARLRLSPTETRVWRFA